MKKLSILILLLLSFIFLPSCMSSQNNTVTYADGPKLRICATISPIYSIAADLISTRRNITLEQIVPPGTDPAAFEMTEAQCAYFSAFDMCIINGMGYDVHIAEKLAKANPKIKIVNASSVIEKNAILMPDGKKNPKVWVSPACIIMQYEQIAAGISSIDKMPGTDEASVETSKLAEKEIQLRFAYTRHKLLYGVAPENLPSAGTVKTVQDKDKNKKKNDSDKTSDETIKKDVSVPVFDNSQLYKIIKINSKNSAVSQDGAFAYLIRDCSLSEKFATPADASKAADSSAVPADASKAADSSAVPADASKATDSSAVPADASKATDSSAVPADASKATDSSAVPADVSKPANSSASKAQASQAKPELSVGGFGDANVSCCLYDIMKEKKIMPDTIEKITLKNMKILRDAFEDKSL